MPVPKNGKLVGVVGRPALMLVSEISLSSPEAYRWCLPSPEDVLLDETQAPYHRLNRYWRARRGKRRRGVFVSHEDHRRYVARAGWTLILEAIAFAAMKTYLVEWEAETRQQISVTGWTYRT